MVPRAGLPLCPHRQSSRGPLSPSVHGYCYPSVSECPPVPAMDGSPTSKASDREVGRAPRPSLVRIIRRLTRLFFGQHVRVFTCGTSPQNPQARFRCQGTETSVPGLSSVSLNIHDTNTQRLIMPAGSASFIPLLKTGGFQMRRSL